MVSDTSSPARPAAAELDALIGRYQRSRNRWASGYYLAGASVIVLGASIPIMTTLGAVPDAAIALAGGSIVAVEGVSRLTGFHERYIAARVLLKSLSKERLLLQSGAPPYTDVAEKDIDPLLAQRLVALLDTYDIQVFDALTKPGTLDGPGTSPVDPGGGER